MKATWRWTVALVIAAAAGCGGRVGSGGAPNQKSDSDATGGAPVRTDGGMPDAAQEAGQPGAPADAGSDASWIGPRFNLDGGIPWDALPIPEAGAAADCLDCARDNCRRPVDTCARDEACLLSMACAALSCPDTENPACPRQCSESESTATLAGPVLAACLVDQCEDSCRAAALVSDASDAPPDLASRLGLRLSGE